LIEGRPGHSEQGGRLGLGSAIDPNMTQHLVLDLNKIVGIEEIARSKPWRPYSVGMRIESTKFA
jgi:hypothetical protein